MDNNLFYALYNGALKTYDPDGNSVSDVSGITGDSIPTGAGVAITYDTLNDIFLIYSNSGLYSYVASTKICTQLSPSGAPSAPTNSQLWGNFQYDEEKNVCWYLQYVNSTTVSLYSYRYAGGDPLSADISDSIKNQSVEV